MCGLVIETEADKVIDIRGDKDDPLSRGHVCPKAVALKDIHEDPDRLRKPLKRIRQLLASMNTWRSSGRKHLI